MDAIVRFASVPDRAGELDGVLTRAVRHGVDDWWVNPAAWLAAPRALRAAIARFHADYEARFGCGEDRTVAALVARAAAARATTLASCRPGRRLAGAELPALRADVEALRRRLQASHQRGMGLVDDRRPGLVRPGEIGSRLATGAVELWYEPDGLGFAVGDRTGIATGWTHGPDGVVVTERAGAVFPAPEPLAVRLGLLAPGAGRVRVRSCGLLQVYAVTVTNLVRAVDYARARRLDLVLAAGDG